MLVRSKHSCLLRTFVIFDRKLFYNIDTWKVLNNKILQSEKSLEAFLGQDAQWVPGDIEGLEVRHQVPTVSWKRGPKDW